MVRSAPKTKPAWRAITIYLVLAVAGGAAWDITSGNGASRQSAIQRAGLGAAATASLVRDERLYRGATGLAALADGSEETADAGQAVHLASEILDASFTIALQRMALQPVPTASDPATAAGQQRILAAQAAVAGDQDQLARLQGQSSAAATAQLTVLKAQLGFDQDRLGDATTDAARDASDTAARLQALQSQELALESAARQQSAADQAQNSAAAAARDPRQASGLAGELRALWLLHQKHGVIAGALAAVSAARPQMLAEHNRLEAALNAAALAANVHTLAGIQKQDRLQQQMSRLDVQAAAAASLAAIYQRWLESDVAEETVALHAGVRGALELLLLAALLGGALRGLRHLQAVRRLDRERQSTLAHLLAFAVEAIALLAALMLLFGRPSELVTILGISGAGLLVAFQDTLLSFAGWFVLMGKNGVRLGERVQIGGVVGEVVEIRLLQTTLLEVDGSDPAGTPTGRRVFFPNNFAVRNAYYNGEGPITRAARASETE